MGEAALDHELLGNNIKLTYTVTDLRPQASQRNVEKTGELLVSLSSGFVDSSIPPAGGLGPALVYNSAEKGESVLTRILDELRCLQAGDEFWFVVAFVKHSGVQLLIQAFDELERRGVKGRILTGTYLTFSEPRGLETLMRYPNIETRVYNAEHEGLHVKSYFFIKHGMTTLVTGSSNLTQTALSSNKEWNVALSSTDNGSLVQDAKEAFEALWVSPETYVLDNEFLSKYKELYKANLRNKTFNLSATTGGKLIEPNEMQKEALRELRLVRRDEQQRALVISATGTGKTYLSALDVAQMEPRPKRVLFVVHRERIARSARESYARVLGDRYTYGLITNGHHDLEASCVFATIQTLSRDDYLGKFSPDHFDYIVIDEVHRAGAAGYRRMLDHFTPKFLLGMSATPERNDDIDVFALFNHVVAYEIRLSDAIKNHLVTPFHYFGVTAGDEVGDDVSPDPEVLAGRIIEQSDKYGFSGPRLKCLVFCSNVSESEAVASELRRRGRRAISLSGSSSDAERSDAIDRLEQDEDASDSLEFIVTVDIFNEGVDIPTVNQVILARATESAIVFVQQLGRGLRTNQQKEFVTVIDFVGNYKTNYNIPVALYGDRSLQRERLRRLVSDGGNQLVGPTVIQFDEISRERVLKSVNTASMGSASAIGRAYKNLRRRMGKVPSLIDFAQWGEISPQLVFENQSLGSYYALLRKYEDSYDVVLGENEAHYLQFISRMLADGKRAADLIVLKELLERDVDVASCAEMLEAYDKVWGFGRLAEEGYEREVANAVRLLSLQFFTKTVIDNNLPICNPIVGGIIRRSPEFEVALQSPEFKKQVEDLVSYGLSLCKEDYLGTCMPGGRLCLGKCYTRADACRMLCWEKDEHGTINGYQFKTDDWVIFVTYSKAEGVSDSIRYEDAFESPSRFIWFSQNNRSFKSKDYQKLSSFDPVRQRIHLFVKKSDNEGADHYYLGTLAFSLGDITEEQAPNAKGELAPILRVPFTLQHPVDANTYRYLTC